MVAAAAADSSVASASVGTTDVGQAQGETPTVQADAHPAYAGKAVRRDSCVWWTEVVRDKWHLEREREAGRVEGVHQGQKRLTGGAVVQLEMRL